MAAPGWYVPGVPIYEYACMECEQHFEELVRNEQQAIACPSCGREEVLPAPAAVMEQEAVATAKTPKRKR